MKKGASPSTYRLNIIHLSGTLMPYDFVNEKILPLINESNAIILNIEDAILTTDDGYLYLITILRECLMRKPPTKLIIVFSKEKHRRFFRICKLETTFTICSTEEEAIKKIRTRSPVEKKVMEMDLGKFSPRPPTVPNRNVVYQAHAPIELLLDIKRSLKEAGGYYKIPRHLIDRLLGPLQH